MSWCFKVKSGGLVWPDPGRESPHLREALEDCVPSLSPAGTSPSLSTFWIDHLLAGLSPREAEPVLASGSAWSLVRHGDVVGVRFDYAEEGEDEETIPVEELVEGLTAYRDAVTQAIESGHHLEERWWAQKNPP